MVGLVAARAAERNWWLCFKRVWRMCGSLVGGVGPKDKACYLLREKRRFAFRCPLWPTTVFIAFGCLRLLPGVLGFNCSTDATHCPAHSFTEIAELPLLQIKLRIGGGPALRLTSFENNVCFASFGDIYLLQAPSHHEPIDTDPFVF